MIRPTSALNATGKQEKLTKIRFLFRILSARVSLKAHLMEVHHEVYQEDPDWVELLVDEEHKKQLKVVSKVVIL